MNEWTVTKNAANKDTLKLITQFNYVYVCGAISRCKDPLANQETRTLKFIYIRLSLNLCRRPPVNPSDLHLTTSPYLTNKPRRDPLVLQVTLSV